MPSRLPIFVRRTKGGAYWYCYVRTADGRRFQRALHIRADGSRESERAATAAYWQEQARATAGENTRTKPKTLGEALKALHREQQLAEIADETQRVTLWAAEKLTSFWGSDHPLDAITSAELVRYATEAKTVRAAVSVHKELSALYRAMRSVDFTPPRKPDLGDMTAKPQEPLSESEVRQLILAAKPRHKLPLMVLVLLGVRRKEYRLLTAVDWDRQLIYIAGTKTKRSKRWVPIPDELFEHMLELKAANSGEWPGFRPYSTSNLYLIVKTTAKRAGLGHRHPNDLRGTHATLLALAGVSPAERAAMQGNSELMQSSVYSQPHTAPEALHAAAAKMPRIRPKPHASTVHQEQGRKR